MKSLHIKIKSDETYDHLMWFLRKLDQEELQFVEGKNTFSTVQEQLLNEIQATDSGESTLMELDEFDKKLDELIFRNEG
ncbi:hypothetical protein BH23BAC2_BH23BAC2_27250 [soil metagenome]